MLLFVIIGVLWLAIALLVLAICRGAARGDEMLASTATLPARRRQR